MASRYGRGASWWSFSGLPESFWTRQAPAPPLGRFCMDATKMRCLDADAGAPAARASGGLAPTGSRDDPRSHGCVCAHHNLCAPLLLRRPRHPCHFMSGDGPGVPSRVASDVGGASPSLGAQHAPRRAPLSALVHLRAPVHLRALLTHRHRCSDSRRPSVLPKRHLELDHIRRLEMANMVSMDNRRVGQAREHGSPERDLRPGV